MSQAAALDRFLSLLNEAFSHDSLVKLTLGKYRGPDASLKNVFVRPVTLKSGPHFSFVYRHATRDVTKNHPPDEVFAVVKKLLPADGAGFLDAHLFTTTQTVQLDSGADGRARLRIKKIASAKNETAEHAKSIPDADDNATSTATIVPNSMPAPAPGTARAQHDRVRTRVITLDAPWLRALGVTNNRAQLREGMSAKFRQINKFAELLSHLAVEAKLIDETPLIPLPDGGKTTVPSTSTLPLRAADMGCGKGYLTFATAELLGERARVLGVESRADLASLCNRVAREQGFANLSFEQGSIASVPFANDALDILVALHACDTATDDAIHKGICAGARLIIVSPCCQKELRPQLTAPPILASALRHGIFQERQAEFVTDALRAQLLEYAGYRTKVFEFISTEHTAKNVMIAAIKTRSPNDADNAAALENLRDFARFYGIRKQSLATHLNINLAP